jgi:hypothetical protein
VVPQPAWQQSKDLDGLDDIEARGIEEVSHPERVCDRPAPRDRIDADDAFCAGDARTLHHIRPDPSESKHDDGVSSAHVIECGAYAGGDAAAEEAHDVERRIGRDLGQRDLW